MEIEKQNTVLVIDKSSGEWEIELILDFLLEEKLVDKYGKEKAKIYSDLEAAKEYLAEPDKYKVVFRECSCISGATLREAYDLAKAHPEDYFNPETEIMSDQFINYSAEEFIKSETELYDNDESDINWDDIINDFFWARRLSADEERAVREKYNL